MCACLAVLLVTSTSIMGKAEGNGSKTIQCPNTLPFEPTIPTEDKRLRAQLYFDCAFSAELEGQRAEFLDRSFSVWQSIANDQTGQLKTREWINARRQMGIIANHQNQLYKAEYFLRSAIEQIAIDQHPQLINDISWELGQILETRAYFHNDKHNFERAIDYINNLISHNDYETERRRELRLRLGLMHLEIYKRYHDQEKFLQATQLLDRELPALLDVSQDQVLVQHIYAQLAVLGYRYAKLNTNFQVLKRAIENFRIAGDIYEGETVSKPFMVDVDLDEKIAIEALKNRSFVD